MNPQRHRDWRLNSLLDHSHQEQCSMRSNVKHVYCIFITCLLHIWPDWWRDDSFSDMIISSTVLLWLRALISLGKAGANECLSWGGCYRERSGLGRTLYNSHTLPAPSSPTIWPHSPQSPDYCLSSCCISLFVFESQDLCTCFCCCCFFLKSPLRKLNSLW